MEIHTGKREPLSPISRAILNDSVSYWLRNFIILLIAGISAGLLLGYSLVQFNAAPVFSSVVFVGASLCILLAVTVFQILLIQSFTLHLWVCIGEVAGLLFFFAMHLNPWIFFGSALFIFYLIRAFHKGRRDLADHLTIGFRRSSEVALAVVTTGLAVFLSFLYAGLYRDNGLSLTTFEFVSTGASPVLARFVPEFSAEMPADQFFYQFAKGQLQGNQQLQGLSETDRAMVYEQSGRKLEESIVQSSGIPTASGESVTDYFYRVSAHYLNPTDNPKFSLIAMFLIILLAYSTVRFVLFFLKWLVAYFSVMIYRLLLKMEVIYITTEPRTQEFIVVK